VTLTAGQHRSTPADDPRDVAGALERAVAHLRGLQSPEGWWKGELETNVTMDAEDLLLRQFLGIRTERETAETARWIRSQQRADGAWATFFGGPADLNATVEAWVALRLAGDASDAPHLTRAAAFVRGAGGIPATRVFTRIWLALFGLYPWDRLPALPPEVVLLPRWVPLNVYDFACWARQTIVPLTVVASLRPTRPLPFGVDELQVDAPSIPSNGSFTHGSEPDPQVKLPLPKRSSAFWKVFDRALRLYDDHPVRPLRRLAVRRALRWVLDRQEADGCWGGIQPPWVYSLLALHLTGSGPESPPMKRGLAGLERFTIREETPDGIVRRLEACQSPVWDTGLAVTALRDAGVPADDEAVVRAADWLVAEEVRVRGDWAVRVPRLAPGGWAFEFDNDLYPDVDDTAEILLALRRAEVDDRGSIARGLDWMVGMQSSDGGWAAFDVDNTSDLPNRLPFCDFGEVIDPPSADVTAHVVEALAHEGRAGSPECRRGIQWLRDAQEADGSWFGRWGVNHLYGTGAVVPALVAAGVPAADPAIRRAVAWLEQVQQPDGGWGEDLRSYVDPSWVGRGEPTASQTAWALLALLAAGERGEAVQRGVRWLVGTQRPDGTWDEPWFTGTGFPWDFSINYHLYRLVFPVSALGRYLGNAS
jgi:squalene-hopene/tetraprenyl-beta-curcumene cyclase